MQGDVDRLDVLPIASPTRVEEHDPVEIGVPCVGVTSAQEAGAYATGHKHMVYSLAEARGNRCLIAAGKGGRVSCWLMLQDEAEKKQKTIFQHQVTAQMHKRWASSVQVLSEAERDVRIISAADDGSIVASKITFDGTAGNVTPLDIVHEAHEGGVFDLHLSNDTACSASKVFKFQAFQITNERFIGWECVHVAIRPSLASRPVLASIRQCSQDCKVCHVALRQDEDKRIKRKRQVKEKEVATTKTQCCLDLAIKIPISSSREATTPTSISLTSAKRRLLLV